MMGMGNAAGTFFGSFVFAMGLVSALLSDWTHFMTRHFIDLTYVQLSVYESLLLLAGIVIIVLFRVRNGR